MLFVKKTARELVLSCLPHLLNPGLVPSHPFDQVPVSTVFDNAKLLTVGDAAFFDIDGMKAVSKVNTGRSVF